MRRYNPPAVTKMPRKKLSDCSEHMKILKARLIEISLKVDNYIYKQKPISKFQAKAFLNEIATYKSHCQNDIGYIQVIEKLTKYMNIIISNKIKNNPVKDVNLNHENVEASENSTSTKENLSTLTETVTESINHDTQIKSHNATDNQNSLVLTLHNESPSDTVATSADKYESDKQWYNAIEERSNVKKAMGLEKCAVTNISSKVLENGAHIECYNEMNLPQTAHNKEQDNKEFKDDNKAATNNDQSSQIQNKVQSPLKNDYRLLICVDGGVINEIKHISNATVIHQAPELDIPLNAFVLNNTKIPNTLPRPKVIQNNLKIKSSEKANSVPANNKSGNRKINNKKVKFSAPYNDVTKISMLDKKKSDDENNNNKELLNVPTSDGSQRNIVPKKRPRKTINKSQRINAIKTKHPAIKRKVNERKNIVRKNLPNDITSSTNDLTIKAQDDLSWFDGIKYVRKIDEQEYFKSLQPLDDNFWYNPSLLPTDDRDFNM